MAGRDLTLRATPAAAAAIDRLRGKARKSYGAFEAELRKQGCRVAGYRLLGIEDGGYSEFCCKQLVDDWRAITTFEPGVAIVVAVGRCGLTDRAAKSETGKGHSNFRTALLGTRGCPPPTTRRASPGASP
jgi:hypothetical protein